MISPSNVRATTVVLLACALQVRPAAAAEWYLQPNLSITGLFDTNYQTAASNPGATTGLLLAPQLQLGRRTETLDVSVLGGGTLSRFGPRSELNRESMGFGLRGAQLLERGDIGGSLSWSSAKVQDAIDETDTANPNGKFATLRTIGATLSSAYRLTERDTLSLGGGFSSRQYDSKNLISTRSLSGSATLSHAFSERWSGLVAFNAARTAADDASQTVNNIFHLQAGAVYQVTERLRVRGTLGPGLTVSRSKPGGVRQTRTSLGHRFDFGVNYAYDERTQVDASVSRSVEPGSGTATNVQRTRASVTVSRQVGPRLGFGIGAGLIQSKLSDTLQRDGYSIEPSVNWRLDEKWSLRSSYKYRRTITTDSTAGTTRAQAHGIYLTLTAQLPPWTWSGR